MERDWRNIGQHHAGSRQQPSAARHGDCHADRDHHLYSDGYRYRRQDATGYGDCDRRRGAGSNPLIIRFEANPTNIISGESSTLSWTTADADSRRYQRRGYEPASSGSRVVSPTVTTTYTLTATGRHGTTSRLRAGVVTVTSGRLRGFCNSRSIRPPSTWAARLNSAGMLRAQRRSISSRNRNCEGHGLRDGLAGHTTTYILTAFNGTGSVTASATLTVGARQDPDVRADAGILDVGRQPGGPELDHVRAQLPS